MFFIMSVIRSPPAARKSIPVTTNGTGTTATSPTTTGTLSPPAPANVRHRSRSPTPQVAAAAAAAKNNGTSPPNGHLQVIYLHFIAQPKQNYTYYFTFETLLCATTPSVCVCRVVWRMQ